MLVELVEDVVHVILESCSPSTLVTLCRVSSTTRSLAIPHLMRQVYLDHSRQIMDFSNFVINNVSDPGAHVFELALNENFVPEYYVHDGSGNMVEADNMEYPVSTWGPLITHALKLMPNLRALKINCCSDGIFNYFPCFVQTLLGLPRLKSLLMSEQDNYILAHSLERAISALKGLIPPKLQKLTILGCDINPDFPETLNPSMGLGWLISQNKMHLTKLELHAIDLRPFITEGHSRVPFASLNQLYIGYNEVSLDDFATAFPALRDLHLSCCIFSPALRRQTSQNSISLPNLVSIQGRYGDVDSFLKADAPRHSVRRVVLNNSWTREDEDVTTITKMVPRLQFFRCMKATTTPLSWWNDFAETVPELTYLNISIPSNSDEDRDLLYNHIPAAISSVLLVYLSLTLRGHKTSAQAIAPAFAKAIPTLKYIKIVHKLYQNYRSMTGVQWKSKTLWKVVPGAGDNLVLEVDRSNLQEWRTLKDCYNLQVSTCTT